MLALRGCSHACCLHLISSVLVLVLFYPCLFSSLSFPLNVLDLNGTRFMPCVVAQISAPVVTTLQTTRSQSQASSTLNKMDLLGQMIRFEAQAASVKCQGVKKQWTRRYVTRTSNLEATYQNWPSWSLKPSSPLREPSWRNSRVILP